MPNIHLSVFSGNPLSLLYIHSPTSIKPRFAACVLTPRSSPFIHQRNLRSSQVSDSHPSPHALARLALLVRSRTASLRQSSRRTASHAPVITSPYPITSTPPRTQPATRNPQAAGRGRRPSTHPAQASRTRPPRTRYGVVTCRNQHPLHSTRPRTARNAAHATRATTPSAAPPRTPPPTPHHHHHPHTARPPPTTPSLSRAPPTYGATQSAPPQCYQALRLTFLLNPTIYPAYNPQFPA